MSENITAGFSADGKHSFTNFGAYISEREIGLPNKKSIREEIPYMNGYYEFSDLNGAPAWGERVLTYKFEIAEASIAEMDAQRDRLIDWLLNIHEKPIYDDTMPDYHFFGSYDDHSISEDGEKTELEVKFVCYPFKIYNTTTSLDLTAGAHTIVNSGQAVKLKAIATENISIQIADYLMSITANTLTELAAILERGNNTVIIIGNGTLTLTWIKEVL